VCSDLLAENTKQAAAFMKDCSRCSSIPTSDPNFRTEVGIVRTEVGVDRSGPEPKLARTEQGMDRSGYDFRPREMVNVASWHLATDGVY